MGKCVVCDEETNRVLFSKAIVKIHICSEKCLRKYGWSVRQTRLKEGKGWLD